MLVIAHRGANSEAPENTIVAFSKAIEIEVDFIELDIYLSKDKEIIVMHDENTKRTTGYDGLIKNMTLNELKKLNCGNENIDAKIPTLEEVINLTKGKTNLQIEIKDTGLEEILVNMLKRYNLIDSVLISSFKHEVLFKIQKINSNIKLATLEPTDWVGLVKDDIYRKKIVQNVINHDFYAIHPHYSIVNEKMVNYAHENGKLINVWTVDRRRYIKQMVKMKVDGIISNNPRSLKELLKELEKN